MVWFNQLELAIFANDTPSALRLIAARQFVRARSCDERRTPLHWAAMRGRLEVVEALIAAGADVDGASISGITALSAAVAGGNVPIVKRLLTAGANARGTTLSRSYGAACGGSARGSGDGADDGDIAD